MRVKDSDNRPNSKRKGKEKFPSKRSMYVDLQKGLVGAKYTACVLIEGEFVIAFSTKDPK